MNRKYILAAAAALMLVACSNEEEAINTSTGNYPEDGRVRIAASLNQPLTRATDPTPYTGTTLGLSVDYGMDDTYTRTNIQWTTADGGTTWTQASETTNPMLWKDATTAAKIYAYAPYQSTTDGIENIPFTVAIDQTAGTIGSDLLGFKNDEPFVPGSSLTTLNAIPIVFDHQLTQMKVVLNYGNEFGTEPTDENVTVKLLNVKPAVTYNAKTKAVTAVSGEATNITLHRDGNKTFTAIIPGQPFAQNANMVEVTITGTTARTFYYTPSAAQSFTNGRTNTLNLRVGKDKLTLSGINVSDWDNDGDDIPGGEAVVPCTVDAENHTVTLRVAGYLTEDAIKEAMGEVGGFDNKTGKLKIAGPINDEDMKTLAEYIKIHDNNGPTCGWINALDLDETSGSVEIPESFLATQDNYYSQNQKLASVKLGGAVTSVGNSAFYNCTSLTDLTFGNSVKMIKEYAFNLCTSLESVIIGENVESIGEKAFQNCKGLKTVVIGDKVTTIGKYAFYRCFTNLTEVTLGKSVKTIGDFAFTVVTSRELTFDMTALTELPTIGKDIFQLSTCSVTVILNDALYSNLGADGLNDLYKKLSHNADGNTPISVTIKNESGTASYSGN